jgi:isopentenyl diphosphate isomerase/L-lactate dehydrogenase-like FMN-dependent dehydrogenase
VRAGGPALVGEAGFAVARAAAARGTAMGLSSFASKPVEEVVAANPKTFFQSYWVGTRDQVLQHIERARAAGAVGAIATVDWSFANGRDWGSPVIPERMDLKTTMRLAPQGLVRPCWLLEWGRTGHLPGLTVPNLAAKGEPGPTFFGAYGQWMAAPLPTWDDVGWPAGQWSGPFMLKGVVRVDDAKRAVGACSPGQGGAMLPLGECSGYLYPGPCVELGENVGNVGLDGIAGQEQLAGDVGIG